MGIRNLNKYLMKHCNKSITKINLDKLTNKTIVVDTSIYLYRFLTENALLENMYLLISILLHYNIEPIFVFDGKPPVEKQDTINKRKQERVEANEQYKYYENLLLNEDEYNKRNKIELKLKQLKRQIVSVNKQHIFIIKRLLEGFGIKYVESKGEADTLCAELVNTNKAWGCLSDDTDMFVYGCKFVLRQLNLIKHTVLLYDTESIIQELNIKKLDFVQILVVSSNDYNTINIGVGEMITLYRKYIKDNVIYSFYIWLLKSTKYITDYTKLIDVYKNYKYYENKNIEIIQKNKNMDLVKDIMIDEGFIFV